MYDAVVIGAGIEGSSTAYNLVRKGCRNVALLEQFDVLHTRGSSHGQSRLTRRAYSNPIYVKLMNDAFPLWSQLEKECGQDLYKKTGILVFGPDGSRGITCYMESLASTSVPHEVFYGEEANRRYPRELQLSAKTKCIFEEDGGILFASKALAAFQSLFVKRGGTLLDKHQVVEIVPGQTVTVVTNKGSFLTKRLVIAAGAWSPSLCRTLGINLPLKVIRTEVHYWKVENPAFLSSDNFPVFISAWDGDDLVIYGAPSHEYPGLIKVCSHFGPEVNPNERDSVVGPTTIDYVSTFIGKTFQGVASKPSITEYCMYTMSPDMNPVMDTHPHFPNIVMAAGFSGHGFKLSPVVGKILAELVMQDLPSYDLYPFQLSRFEGYLNSKL